MPAMQHGGVPGSSGSVVTVDETMVCFEGWECTLPPWILGEGSGGKAGKVCDVPPQDLEQVYLWETHLWAN